VERENEFWLQIDLHEPVPFGGKGGFERAYPRSMRRMRGHWEFPFGI